MIGAYLFVLGLCLGSFVNALVWRIHEQSSVKSKKKHNKAYLKDLSIRNGRSMCPHCKHQLSAGDLVPLFSWIWLRGKCRYCRKPISWQYPLVELLTGIIFILSYIYWPETLGGVQIGIFVLWLVLVVGLIALLVYDFKWYLLPNRLVYPLSAVAGSIALLRIITNDSPVNALINTLLAVVVGGGIFYLLFQISGGKWIGGGDVKLGWLLGLAVGTPVMSLLFIFLAAVGGTLLTLPLLVTKRVNRSSLIPFGPFLIAGAVIAVLFGSSIVHWYTTLILATY
jgi:prepilin signal peptidase PulO-like enzyme (type II secretory pathway)